MKTPKHRNNEDLLWILVDFDGTLATPAFRPDDPLGEPIWENLAKLSEVIEAGYKIHIFTSRHSSDYEAIEAWCEYYGIPISGFVHKPLTRLIIDDRAINASEDSWLPNG